MKKLQCLIIIIVVTLCCSGSVSFCYCYSLQHQENDNNLDRIDTEIDYYEHQNNNRNNFFINPLFNKFDTRVTSPQKENDNATDTVVDPNTDSWSIIWYIASFGGLIGFFLIVSCSEWCCRKHIRNHQETCTAASAGNVSSQPGAIVVDVPPPSYDQFAPPDYDTICVRNKQSSEAGGGGEKSEYDVYVVPVHAMGTIISTNTDSSDRNNALLMLDEPPSYFSVEQQLQQQQQSSSGNNLLRLDNHLLIRDSSRPATYDAA